MMALGTPNMDSMYSLITLTMVCWLLVLQAITSTHLDTKLIVTRIYKYPPQDGNDL